MRRPASLFLYAAGLFVGAAVVVGLVMIPAPWIQRRKDLDEARVRDLTTLSSMIVSYYREHGHLPESVEELPGAPRTTDVATKAPYGYIVNNLRDYQLCASFESDSATTTQSFPPEKSGWKHGQGRQCFSLAVPTQPLP
jgi:hypothetical protein